MPKKRKPSHPGKILNELYIKPLDLNLEKLAQRLHIARNTLYKIRTGRASITPYIAVALSRAFDTTPQLWLNLQQTYDIWVEENEYVQESILPIVKNGKLLPVKQNNEITRNAVY